MEENIRDELQTHGYIKPTITRVSPNIRTGAKYAALMDFEADQRRTEGQIYTLFYMTGLLGITPDKSTDFVNGLIAKYGGRNFQDCTIAEASQAITDLSKEVEDKKQIKVLKNPQE